MRPLYAYSRRNCRGITKEFHQATIVSIVRTDTCTFDETTACRLAGTKRLLIKTNDVEGPYQPLMTARAASLLIAGGLVLIGTERLSVDDSRGLHFLLHHLFLGAGCVIVEGLLLADVKEGAYFLQAAPLRVAGMEASPIRAFLQAAL